MALLETRGLTFLGLSGEEKDKLKARQTTLRSVKAWALKGTDTFRVIEMHINALAHNEMRNPH